MNKAKLEQVQGTMKGFRFGIEIETTGRTRRAVADAIQTVVGGNVVESFAHPGDWTTVATDGRKWQVVYDGSLTGSYSGQAAEITSPILTYADMDTLQAVVRAVRGIGAKADPSCGIHIHVDGASFNAKSVKNLVRYVYSREDAIESALRIKGSRRRDVYCRPVSPQLAADICRANTMAAISRLWYGYERGNDYRPSRYDSTRYHGVNLNSLFYRGTIEFRWFNGSLHAGVVKAYVQLVLALASRAQHNSSVGQRRPLFGRNDVNWILTTQLGLVGDEFKATRKHLCGHLDTRERTPRARRTPTAAQPTATAAAVRMLGQDEADAAAALNAANALHNASGCPCASASCGRIRYLRAQEEVARAS